MGYHAKNVPQAFAQSARKVTVLECVEVGDVMTLDDHALGVEEGNASAYRYVFEDHLLRHGSHREQSNGEERQKRTTTRGYAKRGSENRRGIWI